MSMQATRLWLAATAMVGTLCVAVAPSAIAASHVVQVLTATSHAPGARGRANLILKTASQGRLRVVARGLAPDSSSMW